LEVVDDRPAVLLALAGCGTSGYDTGALAKDITTRLDRHAGFAVRSVSCPKQARKAKGVVIHCSATLRDGDVVKMRATQLDDKGAVHLVGSQMFADNVERGITANRRRGTPRRRPSVPTTSRS
jgi:Domain of unknown function (DUF4333)